MDVISALERTLSQTNEPGLRQQLAGTIERLRERKRGEDRRVPPRGDSRRRSQPNASARKARLRTRRRDPLGKRTGA
jgi:hypothetical protein